MKRFLIDYASEFVAIAGASLILIGVGMLNVQACLVLGGVMLLLLARKL